ncbi:MarR family winged helix-turn-helix transcriptional regulator [Glutamicibacter protophormiae]|uniref:MarR family winged helix-turn-helix transcriptional regulator n=1 Tax=Glutamicibacter protophormiae TaxID=37930 RepID=UPI00195DD0F1|nr:helix-turn-helix domain-containing protein [Glutamicibacter protophormiae]QRQ78992.1 MarR family transcriptional regulator [Glutamicibacter protophormiae]
METASNGAATRGTERAELYEAAEQQLLDFVAVISRTKREVAARMEHRLTPAALPVLGLIMRSKRISQSEICDRLLIDKAALSRMVAKLEELGLVTREVDPEDRRVSQLLPTDLAVTRWREWLHSWRMDLRARMEQWSDEDLGALTSLIGRLNLDIACP